MHAAEVIYHNQHPFVRLPDNFPIQNNKVYIRPNPETGNLELIPTAHGDWSELRQMLQNIGEVETVENIKREPAQYRDPITDEAA